MGQNGMVILGIETSCDETSAAVVADGRKIISNVVSSQVDLHKEYGGVVPEIASRRHVELILPVIDRALKEAQLKADDIDVIGAVYGPGLVGALLVGLSAAKGLSLAIKKPIVGVRHIDGHIAALYLSHRQLEPPFICLVASGGHSSIYIVKEYAKSELLGRTRDDAAGEAFDKISRILGMGYPGGPAIDSAASTGNPAAYDFPRVQFRDGSFDFSFSGLKTAVTNCVGKLRRQGGHISLPDICASFQQAVVDVLIGNTIRAAETYGMRKVAFAGGVASNTALRRGMEEAGRLKGMEIFTPPPSLCTDNAAMIAGAAYFHYLEYGPSDLGLDAAPYSD